MKTRIAIIATSILTILFNILANLLPLNNIDTKTISDSFVDSYFIPAGYVFSIWGIIYLAWLAFSIYIFTVKDQKTNQIIRSIAPAYVISGVLNSFWLVAWHYQYFLASVVIIVLLLLSLIYIYEKLKHLPYSKKNRLLIKAPFSLYLAWISVATIANISNYLSLTQPNLIGINGEIWGLIMIVVAGILGGFAALKQKDIIFGLVVIWAVIGIAINFPNSSVIPVASLIGVAITTFGIALGVLRKLQNN